MFVQIMLVGYFFFWFYSIIFDFSAELQRGQMDEIKRGTSLLRTTVYLPDQALVITSKRSFRYWREWRLVTCNSDANRPEATYPSNMNRNKKIWNDVVFE